MTDFQFLARGIALAGCGIGAGCALIAGGKLMTYRLMAEWATDLACKKLLYRAER